MARPPENTLGANASQKLDGLRRVEIIHEATWTKSRFLKYKELVPSFSSKVFIVLTSPRKTQRTCATRARKLGQKLSHAFGARLAKPASRSYGRRRP